MRVPGKGEDGRRGPGDVILRCFWQGGTGLNCYHKRDQRENLRFEDLSLQKPAHATVPPIPACHLVESNRLCSFIYLFPDLSSP